MDQTEVEELQEEKSYRRMPAIRESSSNYHDMALFVYQLMEAGRGKELGCDM
jgi:hypothetical protein